MCSQLLKQFWVKGFNYDYLFPALKKIVSKDSVLCFVLYPFKHEFHLNIKKDLFTTQIKYTQKMSKIRCAYFSVAVSIHRSKQIRYKYSKININVDVVLFLIT